MGSYEHNTFNTCIGYPTDIEWRSHAPSGRAHGTYEIEKNEWESMERKQLSSGPSLYMPWITHMLFVDLNDNFSCKEN